MANAKAEQSMELLKRVNSRLMNTMPHMAAKAPEFVMMFLLCVEEFDKLKRASKPDWGLSSEMGGRK